MNPKRLKEIKGGYTLDNVIKKGIEIAKQNIPVSQKLTVPKSEAINIQKKETAHIEAIGFVYLLLDCSGSMEGQKLKQAKIGALKFAGEAIAKGYRVGLIQFASRAVLSCEPQRTLSHLDSSLREIRASGSTNMTDAIQLATQKLLDKGPLRSIYIVTDGMPDNPQTALDAAQRAKKHRIDIITIGTDDADDDFLKKIATRRELGIKVSRDQFENTISSVAKMLPLPPGH